MRTRAYRRHHRARIRARHVRDYYARGGAGWSGPGLRRDVATRHPMDCGRRCYVCHGSKLLGIPDWKYDYDWRAYEVAASLDELVIL